MMNSTAATEYLGDYLAFIEGTTGITVPETDYRTLGEAVNSGASALGLSPASYLARMGRDTGERERFLNRITIGETYFFREERHFRALKDHVFPELGDRGKKVVIWSATCATGEEAWSLAAFAQVHLKKPFTVYATDLNSDSIAALKTGRYTRNSFREDGSAYREIIMRFAAADGKSVTIGPELRELVEPARINLFADPLEALPDDIDLIFFRNTLIYMKPDIKARVVDRLAKKLAPGGFLFLAAPEMPLIMNRELALREADGVYYFTRTPRGRAVAPAGDMNMTSAQPAPAPRMEPREAALPRPRAQRRSFDGNEILRAAALLDEDPRRDPGGRDPVSFMALLLLYALYFINRARPSAARAIIAIIEEYLESAATWHLRGLVELIDGSAAGAANCFRKALGLDADFWPARFYLASVTKESDMRSSLGEFGKCREDIASAPSRGAVSYRFLLEGFSEKYFLEICEHMIRTLGKKIRDGK
jgi:chemotaxis protein methyltransferase CheR